MTDHIKIPLNRYYVEMVKPEKCIRGRGNYSKMLNRHVESDVCNNCFLCSGDYCAYETIKVEYADGEYDTDDPYDDDDTYYFEQFCCPNCGELIAQHSERIITWDDIECEHCKSEFVCINDDHNNNILTLARKPREI